MFKKSIVVALAYTIAAVTIWLGTCCAQDGGILDNPPVQVPTGVPPFQSFGGGPDIINLGNLNVHYSIPVFGRAGRGTSLNYALAYDSSVWYVSGSTWAPISTWGLHRDVAAAVGTAYALVRTGTCGSSGDPMTKYMFYKYVDNAGTAHSFAATTVLDSADCTPNSATVSLTDGSGITIDLVANPGVTVTVTLKSGEKIVPSLSFSTGSGFNSNDTNGNSITSTTAGATTTIYDTHSTTARALTITTSGLNTTYTYTAPNGGDAPVTVALKSYSVQTHFGCTGINEYGPVANNLPDKITLPDGSYYQFTYETTPIQGSTNVTGRIASLRLPTGGTIYYTYTGSNNGIMCTDGSTAGLTRQTPDGTWTYSRSGTSPNYTTTITDPDGNQTAVKFNGYFETERKVYQGTTSTGTLLETLTRCYSGATYSTSCATATVTTPITEINAYTQLGATSRARVDTVINGYGLPTEIDEYDFGASNATRKKTIAYASMTGIHDHLSSVTTNDGSNNLVAKTTYAYDQYALSTPASTAPNHTTPPVGTARGNVTTVTQYTSSSATITRHYHYDDTGMVVTATDVNGVDTTFDYSGASCGNAFPTKVNLPLSSMTRTMTWNCGGSVMTSQTDESGNTTYATFTTDQDFWRPESTKDALNNVTTL